MALLQLGDSPVLSGTLTRPLKGSWTADLEVDADSAPTGRVTLAGAGLSLVGTVVQSQSWNDRQRARIVGGAGGMGRELAPAFYRSASLRTIVTALLSAAGETLSSTSSASVISRSVPVWVRLRGTAAAVLDQVLAVFAPSAVWRHLPDGSVWVGEPTWSAVTVSAVVQDNRGDEEVAELAGEDLSLDAGVTLLGRRVGLVRHHITPAALRSEVSWLVEDSRSLAGVIARLVERIVGPRIDALAAYPARVVSQNADGTLEVRPDSPKLPPMTRVPIRYGVPGVSAKVSAGARVLVEFASGDTSKPVATVWESASVTELTITADKIRLGGDRPLVREGDPVVVMLTAVAIAAATATPTAAAPASGYVLKGAANLTGGD